MFYLVFDSLKERQKFIVEIKIHDIHAVFHYQSLHLSDFHIVKKNNEIVKLPNSEFYTDRLLRLPFYFEINESEVINTILNKL